MAVQELPRTAVRLAVRAARIPLSATETVLGHRDEEAWPPALTFDAAQAQLKSTLGALLGDDVLVAEGETIAAKVTKLRQATELESLADERRNVADDQLVAARERADQRRKAATVEAAQRKAQAARDQQAAERKAEEVAARKANESAVATAAAEAAVDRAARRERTAALAKEAAALDKQKAVAARTRKAATADKAIAASKRSRAAKR